MQRRVLDWFLLTKPLEEARAALDAAEKKSGVHLQQAQLVAEVMKRVAEPAETLPPGNPAAVIIALGREAMASILAAQNEPAGPASEGAVPAAASESSGAAWLAGALDRAPQDVLVAGAGDPTGLAAVKEALVAPLPAPRAAATPEDERRAARVRSFVDTLLWNADAPRRKVDRLLVLRFGRLALAVVVVALIVVGVSRLVGGTNLAAGKPIKTSSSWPGCASDPACDGLLLFHTVEENRPWAEVDLQKIQNIHRVEVKNRPDCCADRIVPLVVEVSTDGQQWTEVGRKNEEFATWTLKFPSRPARYVKLHIDRRSTFHIKELIVQ
jgi:hypothetical protein